MAQKRSPLDRYMVTEKYIATRAAALSLPASQFGKMVTSNDTIYGVVIDIPMSPTLLATLAVYINGAANLYFNNGSFYIGAAQRYQTVIQPSRVLVAAAPRILAEATRTQQFDLPIGRNYNFYLMTKKGCYKKTLFPPNMPNESKDMQSVFFLYQKVMNVLHEAQLKDRAAANQNKEEA